MNKNKPNWEESPQVDKALGTRFQMVYIMLGALPYQHKDIDEYEEEHSIWKDERQQRDWHFLWGKKNLDVQPLPG